MGGKGHEQAGQDKTCRVAVHGLPPKVKDIKENAPREFRVKID